MRRIPALFVLGLFLAAPGPQQQAAAGPTTGLKFLQDLEHALVELADKVRPAVVSISPYEPADASEKTRGGGRYGRAVNAGAGVIIDQQGLVVTNSHVVRKASKVTVTLVGGQKLVGHVIGADEDTDLALLRVDTDKSLPTVEFADSSRLKVGQIVIAIGNPYGLSNTLTFGVISGLNRENVNLSRYEDFIQTDASINPGNSGGPLLNIQGQVVGINTAIINYAQNIGFSIPSNMTRRIVAQLKDFGRVRRGWLGVGIETISPEQAQNAHIEAGSGVLINTVFEGDPADKAGLREGDIILEIAGSPVSSPNRMIRLIGSISPGQIVNIEIVRDGKRELIPVKLGENNQTREVSLQSPRDPALGPPLGLQVESRGDGAGAMVVEVVPEGAADGQVKPGDRILAINGATVTGKDKFKEVLDKIATGEKVYLLVERGKEKFHLALVRES